MRKRRFAPLIGLAAAGLFVSCTEPPADVPKGAVAAVTPTPAKAAGTLDSFVAHRAQPFGAPSFTWLSGELDLPQGATATDAAWLTLRTLAKDQRVSPAALSSAHLLAVHDIGSGPLIAQFQQHVEDVEIFSGGLRIALDRRLRPLSASGALAGSVRPRSRDFGQDARPAVAAAYLKMTGAAMTGAEKLSPPTADQGGYQSYRLPSTQSGDAMGRVALAPATARTKKVWFSQAGGLSPSYYVELDVGPKDQADSSVNSFVVSAKGEVLYQHNMVQGDSYSYRVWADKDGKFTPWDSPQGNDYTPHPTGMRDGKSPTVKPSNLVTLQNAPFSKNDPWLAPGATLAKGNNVWAYADITAPDGFNMGDVALVPTTPGSFDRTYDLTTPPQATPDSIQAVTTHLFYVVNYMHDTFYDAGYDEKSGNAQQDNYMRGGMGGDPVKAEAQDYSGRNNANASTPADGMSPRIQMFLWDNAKKGMTVTAPAAAAGDYLAASAAFGPQTFTFTGDLVIVDDGTGTKDDGCETPFVNAAALVGKIAVISRGMCPFGVKVANAQANNAKGVLIVNNAPGLGPDPMGGTPPVTVIIPTLGITKEDGDKLRTLLMAGTDVTVILTAQKLPDRDGSLDTTIVSHEWGHTLSNRLVGNGNGLTSLQAGGMGEGWSDFVALLTITRPEDIKVPANAKWNGVYPLGGHVITGPFSFYDGIRRYPYSADLTKNPLTFKHIQRGVPLPQMPAPVFGADGSSNDEVHNAGEVWTSMLWECYSGLLRDGRYTFEQADQHMREYLVAGLKLTPNAPTFLEARDALLAAIYASEPKDFRVCWAGFAKRGAGIGATGPDRGSVDNTTVVESFAVGNALTFVSASVDDSVKGCDKDGVLDNNETGNLTVKFRNVGADTLTATTLTVRADNPAVSFPDGATVALPKTEPYQTGTVTMKIHMRDADPLVAFHVALVFSDPSLIAPGNVKVSVPFLGNYDDAAGTSATDTVDAPNTVWSTMGDTKLSVADPWMRLFDGPDGRWHINDSAVPADQYLITPPLHAAMDMSPGFSFKHRFSFEVDDILGIKQYADGGVLEASLDGGMTWTDIGAQITKGGYGGTLYKDNQSLPNRKAFVGETANFPTEYQPVTVNLGNAYKGKTFQIRFRMATDDGTSAAGWDVDEIAFVGITDKPFSSRVANRMMCANHPPVANAGQDQTVKPGDIVTLHGSGTDPDADPLTFNWTQTAGFISMLDKATLPEPKFTAPAVTETTVQTYSLVVNDGTVDSAPATVNITVQVDKQPPIQPPPDNGGCSCQAAGRSTGTPKLWLSLGLLGLLGLSLRRRRRS